MAKHRKPLPEDDDGRTVADMSGIEMPSLWLPRMPKTEEPPAPPQPEARDTAEDRPWEPKPGELSPQDRKLYVLAALKASLLIGLAFVAGLGLVILLLLALWL